MEEKRLGFIKRLVIAVSRPKDYYKTISQGGSRVIGFIALLLIFTTFCGFPLEYIKTSVRTNGFKTIIQDNIPEFQFENCRLEMEEVYKLEEDNLYVYADSSIEEFTYDDVSNIVKKGNYNLVFLLGASNGFSYNGGKYLELDYSKLGSFSFDKDRLLELMKVVNVIIIIVFIILYIILLALYLFMSLIYALIGSILKRTLGIGTEITFDQIFLMALSAKVTMRIVSAIMNLVHIDIPYFNLISFIVTVGYLVVALKGLKDHQQESAYQVENTYGGQVNQNYNSYNQMNNNNYTNNNGTYSDNYNNDYNKTQEQNNEYASQNYYDQTSQDSMRTNNYYDTSNASDTQDKT